MAEAENKSEAEKKRDRSGRRDGRRVGRRVGWQIVRRRRKAEADKWEKRRWEGEDEKKSGIETDAAAAAVAAAAQEITAVDYRVDDVAVREITADGLADVPDTSTDR